METKELRIANGKLIGIAYWYPDKLDIEVGRDGCFGVLTLPPDTPFMFNPGRKPERRPRTSMMRNK